MLRQGISMPGITLTYLFTTLEPGIFFSLFDEKNKDLYTLFKKNMVGGPSIIFHRYHEEDKTKIRKSLNVSMLLSDHTCWQYWYSCSVMFSFFSVEKKAS